MPYHLKAHSIYQMSYHMVFVTKNKKAAISEEIGSFMRKRAAELCKNMGGQMVSAETAPDHIHLLVEMPPQQKPSDVVRVLKTQLSKETRAIPEYNIHISKYLSGDALWMSSYFISTKEEEIGYQIRKYIDSQPTVTHKRKYEKTGKYAKKKGDRAARST